MSIRKTLEKVFPLQLQSFHWEAVVHRQRINLARLFGCDPISYGVYCHLHPPSPKITDMVSCLMMRI